MRLTRDKIQRMVGSKGSTSSGAAGGGSIGITEQRVNEILQDYVTGEALEQTLDDYVTDSELETTLADYATETWVNNNYISIAFFSRLFQAHGTENNQQTDIDPNDMDSTITSIEAMFGFWTEQYLSALGNSGGGSVSLTLANMGDVSLNNLADGQILVYDATEGKWVNTSASIVGNYLPLTGGTLTGDLNLTQGVRIMSGGQAMLVYKPSGLTGISRTQWGVGAIDIQGVIRSSASDLLHRRGISGQSYAILDEYNVKTINGQSIYGTGNIEVGGTGGDADTVDGYHASSLGIIYTYSIPASGCVRITFSDRFAAIISVRKTNQDGGLVLIGNGYGANRIRNTWTQLSPTTSLRWSVPASDSIDKAIEIQNDSSSAASVEVTMLNSAVPTFSSVSSLYSTGNDIPIATVNSNVASATKLETSRSLWGQSFDGTADVSGDMTGVGAFKQSGTINMQGSTTSYCQGIRLHPANGISSIFFGCGADSGMTAGMFGITHNTTGLRIRGQASTSSTSLVDYLTVAYGGNVGIGTTSPSYKLHVNGTLGAGNTSVANLESEGYVSALSDIRKKEVVEYMDGLTIEQIASMPIIKFTWRDRPEEGLQVGSVAQEWQKILPQSVHTTHDGFLSFAESRAALIGTISNSRKLVDHEQRIAELERENKELKLKLNIA